jgi:transposase-like protein
MSDQQNLLPALDASTAVALRDSIEMHGVVVPVVVDQHGRIIDGHHRSRIADDLGISYIKRSIEVADEDEFRKLSVELNTIRRHMPIEERQRIVAELRALGHSVRAIAGTVGAPKSTVADDLKVSGSGHVPAEVVGTDGKRYPATRPALVPDVPEQSPGQTAIPVDDEEDLHADDVTPTSAPRTHAEIEQEFAERSPAVAEALADRDDHARLVRVLGWCDRITATTRDLDAIDHGLSVVDRRSLETYVNSINAAAAALAAVQQVAIARLSPIRSVS